MASELGVVGTVRRISGLGLDYLHLGLLDTLVTSGQAGSNPVAAMPSMHAGSALLVCLFLWPVAGRVQRTALGLYVGAMALTLVYTGEHYVADVLAGWVVAAVAVAAGHLVRVSPSGGPSRRRRSSSSNLSR
jgi:membrane-associated phospholipid phosphatase